MSREGFPRLRSQLETVEGAREAAKARDKVCCSRYTAGALQPERQSLPDIMAQVLPGDRLDHLLQAIKRGNREAFSELYQLTASRLLPIALRIMQRRDLAEDVLQDVYLTIWRQAANYRDSRGQALAWMAAVTRSRAIDRLRRDQRHNLNEAGGGDNARESEQIEGPSDTVPQHLSFSVRQCVEALQENSRKAVLLAYYYGMTHEELAARLNSPLGTVKSWVRRGLAQLKDCLET